MAEEDFNYSYENENIESNLPVDMTMKLPAKNHLSKLEVNQIFL